MINKLNKKKSIAIISPSKKYPGGIYHYTIKTALEFKKYMDVKVISFKKQYPKFLYPGSQKEESLLELSIEDDCEILNWFDYFSWRKAFKIINKNADLVFIPWWTVILALPLLYLARLSKKNGLKVLIEFHNIFDHDAGMIKFFLTSFVIRRLVKYSDLCILHTKENSEKLRNMIKCKVNSIILPLGPLYEFNNLVDPNDIYEIYGLSNKKKYLLMFGVVRNYKGLEYAIKAMNILKKKGYYDYHLLVVGEIWINLRKKQDLIHSLGLKNEIIFINKFIPDMHIIPFFKIAEIIIYPYINATQSGSLNFAFNTKKPIVATNVGGFKEILIDQVNGLLVPPQDSLKLAEAILKLIENKELALEISRSGYNYFKNNCSWNAIIDKILSNIVRDKFSKAL